MNLQLACLEVSSDGKQGHRAKSHTATTLCTSFTTNFDEFLASCLLVERFFRREVSMDSQLETLLNRLLESERAGHTLLDTMSQETADPELKALFANFTDVEVSDTAVLEGLIRLHGGTPSTQTGDFAKKVLQLEPLADQINLLAQGQAWVARKVEQVLALNPPPDIAAFLKEMANRHRHNMEWTQAEAIRTSDK